MKTAATLLLGLLALLPALYACGGWHGPPPRDLEGNGVGHSGGATVISAEELHDQEGSVLRVMMGRVPNMKVEYPGLDRCPAIALRRSKGLQGLNSPQVYVDGTRVRGTCILETLRADDTDRIEIYPQGFTTRPGYATSAHGLILVFTRRA